MQDIVIRNGTIVDGTGKPGFKGDVAIKDGRITAVGTITEDAKSTIDADGAIVTPGFVDIHTHYDGQVSWDTMLDPSSRNGVTSIAMGNCGVGFAPAHTDRHGWLISLLEGVEDIPGTALAEGLTWDWESFPDYLNSIDKKNYTVDIGAHMPHAALRAYVMGERGADHTAVPTDAEIAKMEQLTYEALEAGALGFSTSRTYAHRSRSGENIGTLTASEIELLGIVKALKRSGKGVVQLISDAYLTDDRDFAQAELNLIRKMAEETGRKLSFTVQQSDDSPDRWKHIFGEIDAMVGDGLDVKAQVASRPVGVLLSFASTTNPFMATAGFQRAAGGATIEQRLKTLADPAVRAEILEQHKERHFTGFAETLMHGFSKMFRMTDPVDYEPQIEQSLGVEAKAKDILPAAYVYDVLLEEGGRRLLYMPLINYTRGNLDDCHGMMTGKHSLFGLSDGGAHCGTICDGSFPTTTVALWSKGSKTGKSIPLEQLVHGYSQRNAAHVGWTDRGVIAPGYLADINIIDLDKLALSPPEIVQDLPAGGTRLLQNPRGYRYTIKNGTVTFEDGKWTGKTPGKLLRGQQAL